MMSVASALDPMRAANRLDNNRLFEWNVVTLYDEPVSLSCGLSIAPNTSIHDQLSRRSQKDDLLLIVSSFNQNKYVDKTQLNLIRSLSKNYSMICGVESAAWIIARCGLLHQKRATTHWEDLEDFALAFPEVNVRSDRFVVDGSIVTTGGASPTFDFMLHLIKSNFGQSLAIEVSSIFIYQGNQPNDYQQCASLGPLITREPRIAKAIRIMEENIDEPIAVQQIASRINLSTRQMENLFAKNLSVSPGAYYRHLRLQTARRLVIDTNLNMHEIMLRTGFSSLSAFSRAFKQHFSESPIQLRQTQKRAEKFLLEASRSTIIAQAKNTLATPSTTP
ncbi:MAG: helix-turn-helix domain-containing protein [Gammaproteobacteria bacterium]|nr:helix-turn-helix domain-containing protein [Gammaproteobacteria bacterium]NKB64914.1 helix-turn-helix domain-containing protein [Gammaproteobacteria bacterium]